MYKSTLALFHGTCSKFAAPRASEILRWPVSGGVDLSEQNKLAGNVIQKRRNCLFVEVLLVLDDREAQRLLYHPFPGWEIRTFGAPNRNVVIIMQVIKQRKTPDRESASGS